MNGNLAQDLQAHLQLCQDILALAQRENRSLRASDQPSQFESYQTRKQLLPKLQHSADRLRRHRAVRQDTSPDHPTHPPEVAALIRQNQDLIMKILVLDRENQQWLLRRGLVPPRHLPPASSQRPHFVADLYRRNRPNVVQGNEE
jgi:hypothetical protein